ncbi:MAG TPA: type II secretion system protein [Gemmatimonadaceae bacterium]
MPTRSSLRARRGITLFEAVVAVAIVGITSVSALESVGAGMRAAEKARRATEAEALATSRMDLLDMLTDRELQALPDSVSKGTFPGRLDEYAWTITSDPVSDQAGVYRVHIKVDWATGSYTIRSYQYRLPPLVTRR